MENSGVLQFPRSKRSGRCWSEDEEGVALGVGRVVGLSNGSYRWDPWMEMEPAVG